MKLNASDWIHTVSNGFIAMNGVAFFNSEDHDDIFVVRITIKVKIYIEERT